MGGVCLVSHCQTSKPELEIELQNLIAIPVLFLPLHAGQQSDSSLSSARPSHHSFIPQMSFKDLFWAKHWANECVFLFSSQLLSRFLSWFPIVLLWYVQVRFSLYLLCLVFIHLQIFRLPCAFSSLIQKCPLHGCDPFRNYTVLVARGGCVLEVGKYII